MQIDMIYSDPVLLEDCDDVFIAQPIANAIAELPRKMATVAG